MRKFTADEFGFLGGQDDALEITGLHGCAMVENLDSFANLVNAMDDGKMKDELSGFFLDYKMASSLLALRSAMDNDMVTFPAQPVRNMN